MCIHILCVCYIYYMYVCVFMYACIHISSVEPSAHPINDTAWLQSNYAGSFNRDHNTNAEHLPQGSRNTVGWLRMDSSCSSYHTSSTHFPPARRHSADICRLLSGTSLPRHLVESYTMTSRRLLVGRHQHRLVFSLVTRHKQCNTA